MKRFTLFSLLVVSLVFLPFTGFSQAQDEKNQGKKEAKGSRHPGKGLQGQTVQHGPTGASPARSQSTNAAVQQNNSNAGAPPIPPPQNAQPGSRRNHTQPIDNQAQFTPPQGNRANHYGGGWIDGNAHADWGNSGEHYWNHHHYRWYDGGWIIIDRGYAPGYGAGRSISSQVQQRLAAQGYYNGPVDGDIGPGSRQAIANYQSDQGLRVTGRINDQLLRSLGLE